MRDILLKQIWTGCSAEIHTILLAKTSCSCDNGSNINFTPPMKIGQKLHIYSYWLHTLPICHKTFLPTTSAGFNPSLATSILLRRLQSFSGGFVFFSSGFNPTPVASSPSSTTSILQWLRLLLARHCLTVFSACCLLTVITEKRVQCC